MIISKKFETEDTTFWFRKEIDEDGRLLCQSERFYNKAYDFSSDENYYKIRPAEPQDIDMRELLCHVTSKDLLDNIKKNGLIPQVGEIYKGYWLKGRECKELVNLLEPGIFLMQKRRTFKPHFKKAVRLYVDVSSLNPSSLYVDQAFPDGQSLFYTERIPPEDILIKRRIGGKTSLIRLTQECREECYRTQTSQITMFP